MIKMTEDYLLFPDFHPEQTYTDKRIVEKLLNARLGRMRDKLFHLNKILKYQIKIVDGHSHFKSYRVAAHKLNKMRKITRTSLNSFQRNAKFAIELQHQLMQLSKIEKEMKEWEAI